MVLKVVLYLDDILSNSLPSIATKMGAGPKSQKCS